MSTKEKIKTTSQILEDFFNKNDLVFYKREEKSSTIFLLPYRISKQKLRVDIRILAIDNSNMCRMSFTKRLNLTNNDFSEELLNMNSELINGNLSVASNSKHVLFNVNFSIDDEENVKKEYEKNLYMCFGVLTKLYNKDIIEKQTDNEEE